MRRDNKAALREVEEAIEAARRACVRQVVVARFASVCDVCGERIDVGASIAWAKSRRATHARCFAGEVRQ